MKNKDDIISELREIIDAQAKQIEELTKRIVDLELKLAKALRNSSNSSKSPSSDIVKPPVKKGKRRKRPKRGGQKGHLRKLREPLPPERVDEMVAHEISDSEVAKLQLEPTDEFEIVQHIELLDLPIHVTEHRLRKYLDRNGKMVLPEVPEIKGQPVFGPRMLAMIGWLKSRAHCSYSTIEVWMEDMLQVPVSRGYLAKLCNGTISSSLAEMHSELKQAIPEQSQLGSDETSLKNNGKKNWIWCVTAPVFSLFQVASSRSRSVLEDLIGTDYQGSVHFDYFSANCSFAWNHNIKAQYCWAHLIREIRFLQKHPDPKTEAWSTQLLDRSRRMFSAWHRRDEMTEAGFHRSMVIHRNRFLAQVRKPPAAKEAKNLAARFAVIAYIDEGASKTGQYDLSQDYFRFMSETGVEPTNNHTEQQIRHCVIDRKITQGTRSEAGQRYHERMWTAIATCKKQGRSFFQFLHKSISANLASQPAPSLYT